jgi:hypothetical protein
MKVKIKEFAIGTEVKTNGIGFGVASGKHQGDFYVTKTGIEWCVGKTTQGKGVKWNWAKVMKKMK